MFHADTSTGTISAVINDVMAVTVLPYRYDKTVLSLRSHFVSHVFHAGTHTYAKYH